MIVANAGSWLLPTPVQSGLLKLRIWKCFFDNNIIPVAPKSSSRTKWWLKTCFNINTTTLKKSMFVHLSHLVRIEYSTYVAPKGRLSKKILSWDVDIYFNENNIIWCNPHHGAWIHVHKIKSLVLYQLSSEPFNIMNKKVCTLNCLTGAIGSPQGPAHYNVMSRVFNKVSKKWLCISPQVSWCMLAATWDLHIWCNLNLNNVAPKCRVLSLQQLGTIPAIVG